MPSVKVRYTAVNTKPEEERSVSPAVQGGKGFLSRCVEIIIQDAKDKLYQDRRRKREEYERICELALGSAGKRNGDG